MRKVGESQFEEGADGGAVEGRGAAGGGDALHGELGGEDDQADGVHQGLAQHRSAQLNHVRKRKPGDAPHFGE